MGDNKPGSTSAAVVNAFKAVQSAFLLIAATTASLGRIVARRRLAAPIVMRSQTALQRVWIQGHLRLGQITSLPRLNSGASSQPNSQRK